MWRLTAGSSLGFASMACVSDIQNPTAAAHALLSKQSSSGLLVTPLTLAGPGASQFARRQGVQMSLPSSLITAHGRANYRRALQAASGELWSVESSERLDTVGAVVLDRCGDVSASCSSGGMLLKVPGRLGHASQFGCGTWAESGSNSTICVGISVSGCGEHLVRTQFARSLATAVVTSESCEETNLAEVLQKSFHDLMSKDPFTEKTVPAHRRLAGAIVLLWDRNYREGEFAWVHNAENFCVGSLTHRAPPDGEEDSIVNSTGELSEEMLQVFVSESPKSFHSEHKNSVVVGSKRIIAYSTTVPKPRDLIRPYSEPHPN